VSLIDVRDQVFSRDTNWGDLVVTMNAEADTRLRTYVPDARIGK